MKNSFFSFLLLLFVSFSAQAQYQFKEGYITYKNDQNPTACLIKDKNWSNSPSEIEVQLAGSEKITVLGPKDLKSFRIKGERPFLAINQELPVTRAAEPLNNDSPIPEMKVQEVFVQALVQGKASLYLYLAGRERVFLFTKEGEVPEFTPLLYKVYKVDGNVKDNPAYRRQLLQYFNCNTTAKIQKIKYYSSLLVDYFQTYNKCADPDDTYTVNITDQLPVDKADFRLTPLVGVTRYDMKIDYSDFSEGEFSPMISPALGLELEAVLPFDTKRWSIFLSGMYGQYSSDEVDPINLDFSQVVLRFGLKYYLYLSKNSSLVVSPSVNVEFNNGEYSNVPGNIQPFLREFNDQGRSFSVGVSYSYKQKYYLTFLPTFANQSVLGRAGDNVNSFSVVLGVALF